MSDVVFSINKFEFKDYLPTPLKTLTPLTDKRQLVQDVLLSPKYLDTFPIMEKLDNFDRLWENFKEKVSLSIFSQNPDFVSQWSIFSTQIDNLSLSSDTIKTVPRKMLEIWPLDFSFIQLSYEDRQLLDYFDRLFSPSTNNVWQDLFDSMENVFDRYVTKHISSLASLRDIPHDGNGDVDVINLSAKMLGLTLRDEILNAIGTDKIGRLLPLLRQFYPINSTDDFIRIIEILIGSQILLEHLYTNDYVNFKRYSEIPEDLGAGTDRFWFKTTHINLFVEYGNSKYLIDSLSAPLGSSVLEIVSLFLPINLVFKNFGFYVEINTEETAPGLFFCGVLDSVHGQRTIQTDTKPLFQLIPSPRSFQFVGFNFTKKYDYCILTTTDLPDDYDPAVHGKTIWTPMGQSGWIGVVFTAPTSTIRLRFAGDYFVAYKDDKMVLESKKDHKAWYEATITVTAGTDVYLSFMVSNTDRGNYGITGVVYDANGNPIVKTSETWVSG